MDDVRNGTIGSSTRAPRRAVHDLAVGPTASDFQGEEVIAPGAAPQVPLFVVEVDHNARRVVNVLFVPGIAGDDAGLNGTWRDVGTATEFRGHAVVVGRNVTTIFLHRHDLRLVAGVGLINTLDHH